MKERKDILEKYKWDLSTLMKDDDWNKNIKSITDGMEKVKKFSGKLGNKEDLLNCLLFITEKNKKIERAYVYAHLRKDEDVSASLAQTYCNQIDNINNNFNSDCAFVSPQLSELDENYLKQVIKDERFSDYDKMLKDVIREKKHILSEKEEKLLADANSFANTFSDNFKSFLDADLKFNNVKNSKGKSIPFNQSYYSIFIRSEDRELRKNTMKEMNGAVGRYNTFLPELYIGSVKKDTFYAKARKFKTTLEESLFYEEVSPKVYDILIEKINEYLPYMHQYYKKKEKLLNVDKFAVYDAYKGIGKSAKKCTYEQAIELLKKALSPLGSEYISLIQQAYDQKWIDVMPNKNKNSGAFSWGAYGFNPVVMMNFMGAFDDVSTLAHELGHSMHSYFSDKNNCYDKAGYSIFCAEVASTVNEVLLAEYMIANEKNPEIKRNYIEGLMQSFNSTVFRQAMFSEFEEFSHKTVENNQPISAHILNDYYYGLVRKYFGKDSELIDEIKYEWSRVSHFYRPFYVYKYATGFISAVTIAKRILKEEPNAVENYYKFLKGGCKKSPIELLKDGGADLTNPKTYDEALSYIKELTNQL